MVDEAFVNGIDCSEILVKIEMLWLDVEHDGVLRVVVDECSIALIALGNKPLAFGVPACVCSQNRNFRAHIVTRLEAPGAEDMGNHGRSGRFAVHAADHDAFLRVHDRSQCIGAACEGESQAHGFIVCRIPSFDCGGVNNDFRTVHTVRGVWAMECEAFFNQAFNLGCVNLV